MYDENLIRFIIQRFELNDFDNPTFYIVGFKITCDLNQRDSYIETQIDYTECIDKSDNEICELAYYKMKDRITEISKNLLQKKFILGSEFVPPKS